MKKTDRLHPVISLCVYYGEDPWDGPLCLADMLEIPEKVRPMVSDYKMNLLQLRASETCDFKIRKLLLCLISAVLFMNAITKESIRYIKTETSHPNWEL